MLTASGMFRQEDIYAYTFATPAAVKHPPAVGYENIFNIINPMDFVPQVMPSDWGYGRFGTDLFLPTEEFSSFMGEVAREIREETNREDFGIENNYSPTLNFRTRLGRPCAHAGAAADRLFRHAAAAATPSVRLPVPALLAVHGGVHVLCRGSRAACRVHAGVCRRACAAGPLWPTGPDRTG